TDPSPTCERAASPGLPTARSCSGRCGARRTSRWCSSAWRSGCASALVRSGVALGSTLLYQVRAVVTERDQPPFAVRRVREGSPGEQKQVAPGDRAHVLARAGLDAVRDPLPRGAPTTR